MNFSSGAAGTASASRGTILQDSVQIPKRFPASSRFKEPILGYWFEQLTRKKEPTMIIIGLVLMLIGFLTKIVILWSVGIVVALIGLVLLLLGAAGREIGGRKHYF